MVDSLQKQPVMQDVYLYHGVVIWTHSDLLRITPLTTAPLITLTKFTYFRSSGEIKFKQRVWALWSWCHCVQMIKFVKIIIQLMQRNHHKLHPGRNWSHATSFCIMSAEEEFSSSKGSYIDRLSVFPRISGLLLEYPIYDMLLTKWMVAPCFSCKTDFIIWDV